MCYSISQNTLNRRSIWNFNFFSSISHHLSSMASTLPLHHPTHWFLSTPKVSTLSLSLSLYLCSLFSLSNFRHYVKQLKSFHHGWSPPRPSCSFLADTQNQIRPIRATTEISQYPIFQPPQVEEESSSEVNTTHFSFFIYLLFNFWENLGTRKLNLWVPILHCF